MAGLAKTNDAGDETVTQWLWVNSDHKDKLLEELTDNDLIQTSCPDKTLSYLKIITSREKIGKIKDKIRHFNILQNEMFGPVQELKTEARLEDCNPMEVVPANTINETPTFYITLQCSYGCVTDELAERIATELIEELQKNTIYQRKDLVFKITVNQDPHELVFTANGRWWTMPIITVSAHVENFGEPPPESPEDDVFEIMKKWCQDKYLVKSSKDKDKSKK
ncbi:PREDICTED: uncharacterized protein LOC109584010 [Amphimedon queenslandica]|uniref:Uncharacterized protein n=1 Tax=Amphimedon queenslandica TaxID=400682 RepID=A0A1X7UCL5_AMPQE|nr:PREDICTED: uncharacterized protein LOC109584010 [Amphimedon queenslandica]|eukprot:XP_019855129.1 PREDICTED: uncharacterized protein LOC109584010 [Amphimedon queenslandica]